MEKLCSIATVERRGTLSISGYPYTKTAVGLVSLGAENPVISIAQLYLKAAIHNGHALVIVPLDTLEKINGSILRGNTSDAPEPFINSKCKELAKFCSESSHPDVCIPYSTITASETYAQYSACFISLYNGNRHFRNDLRNQTYSNLLPKLKRLDIKKSSPALGVLSHFLLNEVVLKCYLGNEHIAAFEYGYVPIMSVMHDIFRDRYPSLSPFVKDRLHYMELALR